MSYVHRSGSKPRPQYDSDDESDDGKTPEHKAYGGRSGAETTPAATQPETKDFSAEYDDDEPNGFETKPHRSSSRRRSNDVDSDRDERDTSRRARSVSRARGPGSRRVSFSKADEVVHPPQHSPSETLTPVAPTPVSHVVDRKASAHLVEPRAVTRSKSRRDHYETQENVSSKPSSRSGTPDYPSDHGDSESSEPTTDDEAGRRAARRNSNTQLKGQAAMYAALAAQDAEPEQAHTASQRRSRRQRHAEDFDQDASDFEPNTYGKPHDHSRNSTSTRNQSKSRQQKPVEYQGSSRDHSAPRRDGSLPRNSLEPGSRARNHDTVVPMQPRPAYPTQDDDFEDDDESYDMGYLNRPDPRFPPAHNAFAPPPPIPPPAPFAPPPFLHQPPPQSPPNMKSRPRYHDDPFGSDSDEEDIAAGRKPPAPRLPGEMYNTDEDLGEPVKTGAIYETVRPDKIEFPPATTCVETIGRVLDSSSTYIFRYLISVAVPIVLAIFLTAEWKDAQNYYNEHFSQKVTLGTLEWNPVCALNREEMDLAFKGVGIIGDIRATTVIVASVFAGVSVLIRIWERNTGRNRYGWHLGFELLTHPMLAASFIFSLVMPFISKSLLQRYGSPGSDCAPNATLIKVRTLASEINEVSVIAFIAAIYSIGALLLVLRRLLQKWHCIEYYGQPLQYRKLISRDGVPARPEEQIYHQPGLKKKPAPHRPPPGLQGQHRGSTSTKRATTRQNGHPSRGRQASYSNVHSNRGGYNYEL